MDNIPIELLAEILSNLDLELLKIYCVVCKKWNEAIKLAKIINNVQYSSFTANKIQRWTEKGYSVSILPHIIVTYVVIHNYLNLLKYLISFGHKIDYYCKHYATKYGSIDIVKWYHNHNYLEGSNYIEDMGYDVGFSGNLELIQWLQEIDYPWQKDTGICCGAAKGNHFELLKWLKFNNFPWESLTVESAIKNKNYDMMVWSIENGCPVDEHAYQYAYDDKRMLRYFHVHKLCSCYLGGIDYHFHCPSDWKK